MAERRSSNRRSSVVAQQVTSVLERERGSVVVDENATLDDETLAALGYKQEFKRDFTFLESFSVSFSVLGLLPSVASTIGYSLGYSGTGGAVWGWLVSAILIQSTAYTMAELCSSMPTAGGTSLAETLCYCSFFVLSIRENKP